MVAGVEVVALGQRDGRRADEVWVEAVDRAGGVAEHAVDAHAELLVGVQLLRRLEVLAVDRRSLLVVTDDPRLDPRQLLHEVGDVDDEVADDGEVGQRLDPDGPGRVVGEERGAGQLAARR